ncbi:LapA family protein [Kamptonema sp. UHCC 0994]|uniref:LapA family protein n=1 Tax=Kamptonema sp. UHCC 0994 TaxID=3031329 RepID=UPI0023B90CDB|nr:LapA family protein [Kamptonema sp. UHCC 0994]MDF0553505.1 LapA family protein [Kamptonema sp. UHCC 0994]
MRVLNFFFIFLICLALVVFSLENTEPTTIQIIQGVEFQAPLCVELIIATGLGAVLALIFSLWSRMQRMLGSRENNHQIRQKEQRIQQLEQDIERYKVELEEKVPLLPEGKSLSSPTESIEIEKAETLSN